MKDFTTFPEKELIRLTDYEVHLPRKFLLEDGFLETVHWEDACRTDNPIFRLYIPPTKISPDKLAESLILKQGFEKIPALPKGERYSLRKVLSPPWELHLRIFDDGFLEAEVEVQREYLQHLEPWRSAVIYEAFWSYYTIYPHLHIFYVPKGKFVTRVYEHFRIQLKPPERLTPTTPIVLLGVMGICGMIALALSHIKKPD